MENEIEKEERENDEMYRCVYCCISFTKQGSLRKHLRMAYHWPPIPEDEQLKRKKQSRSKRLPAGTLEDNRTSLHADENALTFIIKKEPGTDDNCLPGNSSAVQPEKHFKCPHCGRAFLRKPDIIRHIRIHTGEKPFSCEYCDSSFIRGNALKRHMRRHTGERPYHCDHCGGAFTEKGNLKKHMRTHTGEKPFVCGECGASFATQHSLRIHLSVHTGIKPFRCADCGASFVGKSQLQAHTNTHTRENPHTCAYCGKAFAQSCDVRKHILGVHTSISAGPFEQRYKCTICNARFGRKSLLLKHVNVHMKVSLISNSSAQILSGES